MNTLDHRQFDQLLRSEGGPHVSIFFAAPQVPRDSEDDRIRLGNRVRETRETLVQNWMPATEAEDFLKPLHDLMTSSEFTMDRRSGMAIFLSDSVWKVFQIYEDVSPRLVVSRSFFLRPLVSIFDTVPPFFVLRISKNHVTLFSASATSISDVSDISFPESFKQQHASVTVDSGFQVHSGNTRTPGKERAVYHGQGGVPDTGKAELTHYLRQLDDVVYKYISNKPGMVILAGVDYETAIYKQIASSDRVAEKTITGNVDQFSPEEMLQRALPIAKECLGNQLQEDASEICDRRHHKVATDPEQVLIAAHEGRINVLFFDKDSELNGSFFEDTRTLQEIRTKPTGQPGDASRDLIEMAMVQTLLHRGRVHGAAKDEMPVDKRMAASLRY
ncbi:hypothetical protein CA13_30590 [Planctomycetes bacterium CA13]|uniref:Uncharacterized protein n=1 Tax=Novipirellula herctigrandis TaxID=2527986 RepID=A0A5C5Z3N7_9BACT|nr:hypothetical protein CA13_30590 [Planctomycetes bacterium CA13]